MRTLQDEYTGACLQGNITKVQNCLDKGVNPSYSEYLGLNRAVRRGHIEVIKFHLSLGLSPQHISPNTFNHLLGSYNNNADEAIKLTLPADYNFDDVDARILRRCMQVPTRFELLLKHAKDINLSFVFNIICNEDHAKSIDVFVNSSLFKLNPLSASEMFEASIVWNADDVFLELFSLHSIRESDLFSYFELALENSNANIATKLSELGVDLSENNWSGLRTCFKSDSPKLVNLYKDSNIPKSFLNNNLHAISLTNDLQCLDIIKSIEQMGADLKSNHNALFKRIADNRFYQSMDYYIFKTQLINEKNEFILGKVPFINHHATEFMRNCLVNHELSRSLDDCLIGEVGCEDILNDVSINSI
ncbi:MAG: hypothetical protein HAW67_03385 [Endozoicomonadaceae bacterium]|nr:hypothetical protein [Endozoicomonadaceae bacterium]